MTEGVERHARRWIAVSAAAFVTSAAILPLVGPASLDWSRVWAREAPDWSILVQLRDRKSVV